MALHLDSMVEFIPEFGDERKKYLAGQNDSPTRFFIKAMNAGDFRRFAAKLAQADQELDGDEYGKRVAALYREAGQKHIERIENLTLDGRPIADGLAFYSCDAVPNSLVLEVEEAILESNSLSEEDEKN